MKKIFLLILIIMLYHFNYGQAPEKFNYQGVLRNSTGDLVENTDITVKLSILQGSSTGSVQYSESHNVSTNDYGLFFVQVGAGTLLSGSFAGINWSNEMYLKTEVANPAGGSLVELGTVQLISVPYALYAKNVENNDDADANPLNEIQNLGLIGTDLSITDGNTVDLSIIQDGVEDADADTTNEIQDLNLTDNILTITNKTNPTQINLAAYQGTNSDEQVLSLTGTDLSISGGNTIDLSPIQDGVDDADNNPVNEIQTLSLVGDTLEISNGNNIVFSYDSSRWGVNGDKLYYNTGNVGIGTSNPSSNLEVKSTGTGALFQVINANNDTVFAVYPDGVKVFVNSTTKGTVGGFAVSGRSPTKAGIEVEYLRVTPDSTRIYVNDSVSTKGKVGGFAVSGRSPTKGLVNDYLHITKDSTRVYITESVTKGSVGGFAVSGRSPTKGSVNDYLQVTKDSTRIYITESATKGSVGGFAVSGRSPTKSNETNDYFNISGNQNAETLDSSEARIFWYPKKEAFLTGRVIVESPDSVGFNSLATGYQSKAIGSYSQAMGYNSIARGEYSTAIGYQAVANDSNSFAFGNYAQALGINSFAFGDSAIVTAEDAYAIGAYAYAAGIGSFAIGSIDRNAHDVALSTSATGLLSTAIGLDADATGDRSFAAGVEVDATGVGSAALGSSCTASGDYSTAIRGIASGFGALSLGGEASGYLALSSGTSTASGWVSTALGANGVASGDYSISLGNNADATGDYAISAGNYTTAQAGGSFVIGYYNIIEGSMIAPTSTDPLFVIGNGTYITPSNALTVLRNGNMKLKGNFYPVTDNIYDIGSSTYRWKTVYSAGGVVTTSDARLKANINKINYGLKEIMQLRPVTFTWKDKPEKGLKLGLIAQEVQPIIKEVVNIGDDENNTLGITYSDLIPVLIKGIQEQQTQIESLNNENSELKTQLQEMNNLYKTVIERLEKLEK